MNRIKSYTARRKQFVVEENYHTEYHSEEKQAIRRIPQWNVLDPMLFLLYMNDLALEIVNDPTDLLTTKMS